MCITFPCYHTVCQKCAAAAFEEGGVCGHKNCGTKIVAVRAFDSAWESLDKSSRESESGLMFGWRQLIRFMRWNRKWKRVKRIVTVDFVGEVWSESVGVIKGAVSALFGKSTHKRQKKAGSSFDWLRRIYNTLLCIEKEEINIILDKLPIDGVGNSESTADNEHKANQMPVNESDPAKKKSSRSGAFDLLHAYREFFAFHEGRRVDVLVANHKDAWWYRGVIMDRTLNQSETGDSFWTYKVSFPLGHILSSKNKVNNNGGNTATTDAKRATTESDSPDSDVESTLNTNVNDTTTSLDSQGAASENDVAKASINDEPGASNHAAFEAAWERMASLCRRLATTIASTSWLPSGKAIYLLKELALSCASTPWLPARVRQISVKLVLSTPDWCCQDPKYLILRVETPARRILTLQVKKDDKVQDLKDSLEKRVGIPSDLQRLKLNGDSDELKNKQKLEDCEGSTGIAFLRLEDSTPPLILNHVPESKLRIALDDWTSFGFSYTTYNLASTQDRQNGVIQSSICVALSPLWLLAVFARWLWYFGNLWFWKKRGVSGVRRFGVDSNSEGSKDHGYWRCTNSDKKLRVDLNNWIWVEKQNIEATENKLDTRNDDVSYVRRASLPIFLAPSSHCVIFVPAG